MKNWKELKKQFWAKLIAMLLAIVSGFVFVVTAAATVLYGTVSELQANQNTVEKGIDIQLLENYAMHLFAEGVTSSDGLEEAEFDGLDGGHIAYTVVKKQDGEKYRVLYTNDASVDADSCMVHCEFDTNTRYVLSGQEDSFLGMLLGSYNIYDDSSWQMASLDHIIYNQEDGLFYADGEKRYILAPFKLAVGDVLMNGAEAEIKVGNCLPLQNIPVGTQVHNIELYPGKGGQLVRSAGNAAQLMAKEGKYATLRLPSGEMRMVPIICRATVGQVGNIEHGLVNIGKAGRKRHMGIRPTVRGSVMNPNDHPHGGGEGRAPIGRPGPSTPWGKPAMGLKTRKKNKQSNKMIVRRRDGKNVK